MLTALRVVDLKGIRDLTVSLRPLTVFVGPNGIGKTTLLEAVFLAGLAVRLRADTQDEKFGQGRWDPVALIRAGADRLRLELTLDACTVILEAPKAGGAQTIRRWLRPTNDQPHEFANLDALQLADRQQRPFTEPEARNIEFLEQAVRVRLDSERIAASAVVSGVPHLRPDGTGLPAFLDYLNRLRNGTLEAIEAAVVKVVPRFRRVHLRSTALLSTDIEYLTVEGQRIPRPVTRNFPGIELLVEFDDGAIVPAAHASEGTLLTLAILAMAHAPGAQRHRLLLIDDLDRALHPSAQHRLIEGLYAILKATPDLQILATTHSPDLVDACDADDVRVLGRDAEGNTAARALTEHPEAAKWLKLLRVGEFWGTVGEDWVTSAPEPHP